MSTGLQHSKTRRTIVSGAFFWPTFLFSMANASSLNAHSSDRLDEIAQPDEQNIRSYLKRAAELAETASKRGEGTRFGAVLVKDGRIIGEGRNRTRLLNDPTAHSEIDAIRDACQRTNSSTLTGCDIYCSARPCPMCSSACYWAGLNRIYVGNGSTDVAPITPSYARC